MENQAPHARNGNIFRPKEMWPDVVVPTHAKWLTNPDPRALPRQWPDTSHRCGVSTPVSPSPISQPESVESLVYLFLLRRSPAGTFRVDHAGWFISKRVPPRDTANCVSPSARNLLKVHRSGTKLKERISSKPDPIRDRQLNSILIFLWNEFHHGFLVGERVGTFQSKINGSSQVVHQSWWISCGEKAGHLQGKDLIARRNSCHTTDGWTQPVYSHFTFNNTRNSMTSVLWVW